MKNCYPQHYPFSPLITTDAQLVGYLLLTRDGPSTDIKTEGWRSLQPEGVQLQLPIWIHCGDSSLQLAQRHGGAWKSLQAAVQFEIGNKKLRTSLPPLGVKP